MVGHGGQTSTQIVILTKPPQSYMVIPLGESDHPDSPHFDDQAEKLFSQSRVKSTYFLNRNGAGEARDEARGIGIRGVTQVMQDALGHLEVEGDGVLWAHGESNVHDVVQRLGRPLAYTTVMTTLDRLFKKDLLVRRKSERAFLYAPRWTRQEWEQKRAGDFVAGFLASPQASGDLLISSLVDAVGQYDTALLDELEKKIRSKRRELGRRGKTHDSAISSEALVHQSGNFFLVHLALGHDGFADCPAGGPPGERIRPHLAARCLLVLRLLPAAGAAFIVVAVCVPSYLWLEPEAPTERVGFGCLAVALLGTRDVGHLDRAGVARRGSARGAF
jgi:predicted transcriptional regulator